MKRILTISASTRRNSTNEAILRTISEKYSNRLEFEFFQDLDRLPHFNSDLDGDQLPDIVKVFRNKIIQSDGVLICSPEYVFSIPGVLKNAIEWTVATTVFTDKPLAYIIAAASGEMAFESLGLIMTTLQAKIGDNSGLIIKGAKGKLDKNSQITDKGIIENINKLMESFEATL